MNHEPSGYPLPLSQANKLGAFSSPHSNATHMPTSWQRIPTPQCHPESGKGGSAGVIVGARGPPGAWPLQRPLEFPQAETRSIRPQLWASGPGLQILGQSDACSKRSSHSGTSPLPPPQGKTPEAAGRIYATKLLPQEHYVIPACLLNANHQPRGIKMKGSWAHPDPSWESLRLEVPTKPRDT